jgi:hypothetical protein
MVTDRHDKRPTSASHDPDERPAFAVSMRSDLVLGESTRISAMPSGPGGVGGSPGDECYLRCGRCGAAIALTQRVQHDGRLVDYTLERHEFCDEPMAQHR